MTVPNSDTRRQVMNRATVVVQKASRIGGVVKATVEARRILTECEAADMSLTEVAEDIARLASEKGLVVEFG